MTVRRLSICLALATVLSGCVNAYLNRSESLNPSRLLEAESDIARTFEAATLALPGPDGEPVLTTMAAEDAWRPLVARFDTPLPVVLYLHGCTGLRDETPLKAIARLGVAVIAPDSFARRFRPLQCRPSQRRGGENVFVYDFRMAELSYALHRMDRMPWIDRSRMLLMGVSEGGVAAALYRGQFFKGRIIAQWTCHGGPLVRGLSAGPQEPVLAIVRANDPWYDSEQKGDCGDFFVANSKSRTVLLPGAAEHGVFDEPSVVQTIAEFIRLVMNE